jgi:hypothetical protein
MEVRDSLVGISIQMIQAVSVECGRAAYNAVDLVTFSEEKLGEV